MDVNFYLQQFGVMRYQPNIIILLEQQPNATEQRFLDNFIDSLKIPKATIKISAYRPEASVIGVVYVFGALNVSNCYVFPSLRDIVTRPALKKTIWQLIR